jgi:putative membrane protein
MKRIASHLGAGALALCAMTNRALAQDTPVVDLHTKPLLHALLSSVIFAAVGMLAVFVAVVVFDKATPRIDIQKELLNNNIAVAILTAAVVIGVSIIVAASIM